MTRQVLSDNRSSFARFARWLSSRRHGLRDSLLIVTLLSAAAVPRAAGDEGQGTRPADGTAVPAPAGAPQGTAPSFKPPTFADDTLMYVFGPKYRNPFIATPSQPDGADI